MTAPWSVRVARPTRKDRARLEAFACAASSEAWDVEVEGFIRCSLFAWAFDPRAKPRDPRLLLVFERATDTLVGIAAHERVTLQHRAGSTFAATKLEVAAVAAAWHGRQFADGARVSDVVMSAVLTDVTHRVPPRFARVLAVIHEDNLRSLALARRHGFHEELSRPHPSYRRLVTAHRDG